METYLCEYIILNIEYLYLQTQCTLCSKSSIHNSAVFQLLNLNFLLEGKPGLFFCAPPFSIMRHPISILLPNDIIPKSEGFTSHARVLLRGSVMPEWRTDAGFSSHLHDSERGRMRQNTTRTQQPERL